MLVTIGSVTTATRTAKIIKMNLGISVQVVRTPSELNRGGCSYSIRFNDRYEQEVRRIAAEKKLTLRKWYGSSTDKSQRVYNALF